MHFMQIAGKDACITKCLHQDLDPQPLVPTIIHGHPALLYSQFNACKLIARHRFAELGSISLDRQCKAQCLCLCMSVCWGCEPKPVNGIVNQLFTKFQLIDSNSGV